MPLKIKRAYDPPSRSDGKRILVDRLWPRGMKKEALALDGWMKEIAPSPELRTWFGHKPERFAEFRKRYRAELKQHAELVAELRGLAKTGTLTLVYGARDEVHNGAVVLRDVVAGGA
ncbi:MAG TPA: DUF488 domain-containing protein [Gemmatimonadales bacterium]|jgi:uncharacterized protein YeaO (DUF488 family)|nr:DUF488 domain-containing protein [Gemmatimonadales bacterium]